MGEVDDCIDERLRMDGLRATRHHSKQCDCHIDPVGQSYCHPVAVSPPLSQIMSERDDTGCQLQVCRSDVSDANRFPCRVCANRAQDDQRIRADIVGVDCGHSRNELDAPISRPALAFPSAGPTLGL